MPRRARHERLLAPYAETLPHAQSTRTAWILRQICHDWPDEETVQILSSVRAAMEPCPEQCTLCLVEVCLPTNILAVAYLTGVS